MAQKRKTDQTEKLAEAALFLAAKKGWGRVLVKDIAKKAKVPLKKAEATFRDDWDALLWVLKKMNDESIAVIPRGGSWRDKLFDVTMTRFDLAQAHRDAFTRLPRDFAKHPKALHRFAKPFCRAMEDMLHAVGLKKSKRTPALVAAFGLIYLSVTHVWSQDDTRDLAKTMAALDKRLGLFEQLVEFSAS